MTIRQGRRLEALSPLYCEAFVESYCRCGLGHYFHLLNLVMFFFSPPWENKHCTYKIKPELSVSFTWRGQGHGSTVILKLTCSLKRRGSWQRSTYAKRGGRARWVGGGRRWKDRRRRRKRKDETDRSYPTRYPEWQPGNKGSIKAALGGQSEEQADGLSSAPSSARYAPLPVNNPLPSLFHVSFFFFLTLPVSHVSKLRQKQRCPHHHLSSSLQFGLSLSRKRLRLEFSPACPLIFIFHCLCSG